MDRVSILPLWLEAGRLAAIVLATWPGLCHPQSMGGLGGPSSVPSQVHADREATTPAALATQPWYRRLEEARDALRRDHGLSLGTDYNVLYQYAGRSPAQNDAAGNVLRLYGTWSVVNEGAADAGSLVFKAEYRGTLGTSLSPQALGPSLGYAGLTAVPFSDAGALLTNFYWTQAFADNRFAFVAGVVDVTDYLDVYALINPWTEFNNLSFSTNPTIPAPNQGLGAALRWMFTPNHYVVAGLADANGDPQRPEDSFRSFLDVREYFYHAEIGWISSWDKRFSDNVHVSVWGQDPRNAADIARGRGVTLSASTTLGKRWTPFVRAGYSDGGGALVDRMIGAGIGYRLNERNDFIGFGISWARPPGSNENQYTFEAYWRWQPAKHVQIVPDLQLIINPANNPSLASAWLAGLRVRIAF
jgi:porin